MTDFLDASALVALSADEPAAAEVERIMRAGQAAMTASNLSEVVDVLQRVERRPLETIRAALGILLDGALTIVPVDADLGWRAGEVRARRYHRTRSPLSLADCHLLAAAFAAPDTLATSDHALARAARAEGIEVVALPNSRGRRPAS